MSKLILVLLILNINLLVSQDLINPPKLQRLDTTTAIDRSKHFVKGWNWGSPGRKLDSAMLMNTYHDFPESSSDTKYNVRTMEVPGPWGSYITGGRNYNYVFLGQALNFEPSISVDSTENFRPRYGDINGAVFGFYNRNFSVGDTVSNGLDFDRYKLYLTGISPPPMFLKEHYTYVTFPKLSNLNFSLIMDINNQYILTIIGMFYEKAFNYLGIAVYSIF